MIEAEVAAVAAQFGAAGLMGWMWLTERRWAAVREKQLTEAHEQVREGRMGLDVVLRALEGSTRAMAGVENAQREQTRVLRALLRKRRVARGARDKVDQAGSGTSVQG